MSKISITKKTAWSLILKINAKKSYKNNLVSINETISENCINISYNRKHNHIEESNLILNQEISDLFKIFLPVVCSNKKTQFIAHIAQSLDGFIATDSGESKYISGKDNIEHIHRLRAISDVIIVGANTYIEDKPKLSTRLVEGSNPKIYIFDPKRILKKKKMSSEINLITDMSLIKRELNGYKTIYVEGGGKTISQFMKKNILNRIHICLCPIILGGGRPSFIQDKYVSINNLKSHVAEYYKMGDDVLLDLKI
tara:strand:+ start:1439 stop:2200 length:762 start_codon:yes stop_codon:yes gene_type:complete